MGDALTRLDGNTESLMLNAAKVVAERDAEHGLLSTSALSRMRDELSVTHIFVTDKKGNFIRSTNEDPTLIPNAFSFCPGYQNLVTGKSNMEATPIIPPQPEPKPYKFVFIPSLDHQRLLEVGTRVDFVAKTLTEALGSDSNIVSLSLFAPDGSPFGKFSSKGVEFTQDKLALSVLNLPQLKAKKWDYYSKGIVRLDDIRLTELSPIQERVVQVFKTGQRIVDGTAIKAAVDAWVFPLIFLDFETINPAIPRYNGTGPYQQVPFQFSAHIWESRESELNHKEYLHTSKSDPRPNLVPALLEACGKNGSIVAYYGQFESSRIAELAEYAPSLKEQLKALIPRIVDPLPIIRDHVYDNRFYGSFSLKDVAPAILGEAQSYEGMLVSNGSAAQRAFEELISDDTPRHRKAELINASLEYCKKDTLVMVELVKWLFQQH
jgi:hypothetical protein